MVVLKQFYQIVERQPTEISPLWKGFHILCFVVAAVCGFLTAFTFGRVLKDFGYNCILHSDIVFSNSTLNITKGVNGSFPRAIDLSKSVFSPIYVCNLVQFTPLIIMISAIIWGTYFAISSRGGAGYPTDLLQKPWSLLYPCIFFTVVFFIVYIISTIRLENGLSNFCKQFKAEFNNTGCVPEINIYAQQFIETIPVSFYAFYPNIRVALVSSKVGIWTWVTQIVFCVIRMCFVADFELQMVVVTKKEEEEIIENVELGDQVGDAATRV